MEGPTGEIAQHGALHGHARVHKEDLKRIFCQNSVHNLYPNKTSPWNTLAIPSNNSMLGRWMVYQIEGHLPWRRCNGPVSFETMDGEFEPFRIVFKNVLISVSVTTLSTTVRFTTVPTIPVGIILIL